MKWKGHTVNDEHDGLGLGTILRSCNIGVQVSNRLYSSRGSPFVDLAREAAFAVPISRCGPQKLIVLSTNLIPTPVDIVTC
jgi:hypothetical protein